MYTSCRCGTEFRLNKADEYRQKVIYEQTTFRCKECLEQYEGWRRHPALMAFQKTRSNTRTRVRRVLARM